MLIHFSGEHDGYIHVPKDLLTGPFGGTATSGDGVKVYVGKDSII
jgi:hypothetical protein